MLLIAASGYSSKGEFQPEQMSETEAYDALAYIAGKSDKFAGKASAAIKAFCNVTKYYRRPSVGEHPKKESSDAR